MTDINKEKVSNQSTPKNNMISFKPSILTSRAEAMRTDKAACTSSNKNDKKPMLFMNNDLTSKQSSTNENVETNFVSIFGENILSRTTGLKEFKDFTEEDKKDKDEKKITVDKSLEPSNENELRKNAEEIQKHSVTRLLQEAEKFTGEEDELSVLRLSSCKIFQYNAELKEFVGKGFCNIHLNDTLDSEEIDKDKSENSKRKSQEIKSSRLVARSTGGLQIFINTPIWHDMALTRVGSRSIRLSAAQEDGKMVVFVLTPVNQNDATLLFDALEKRRTSMQAISKTNLKRTRSPSHDNAIIKETCENNSNCDEDNIDTKRVKTSDNATLSEDEVSTKEKQSENDQQ